MIQGFVSRAHDAGGRRRDDERLGITHAIILVICATGLYIESVGHEFHYDDFHSLVENPHIRSLVNLSDFFVDPTRFSSHSHNAMYRPVLLTTYALNHALDGLDPRGYHLFNVVLHGINCILVWGLVGAITGNPALAFLSACLFAIHPINSEAVNYVSSRSEMLMAGFFMSACLAYLRFAETGRKSWYVIALLSSAVALLSKSVGIVIPGAWAVIDRAKLGRGWRRKIAYYLPLLALAIIYLIFTRGVVGKALLTPVRSLDLQVLTQVKAWVYYFNLIVMPVNLSVEHQFFSALGWFEAANVWAILFLLSLAWVLFRSGPLGWAGAWWALVLAPTALVPLIVLVNEHRLYLAFPAIGLSIAYYLCRLRSAPLATFFTVLYFLTLAVLTLQRTAVWEGELSLWGDAAGKGPLMLKPHLRYGDALVKSAAEAREPDAKRKLVTAAEAAYLWAVQLRPQHPGARNNLGLLYLNDGRLADAKEQFSGLLEVSPDIAPARLNLARVLLMQKRWREAEQQYLSALEYGDTGGIAHGFLGHIAYTYRDDAERALRYYDQAIQLATSADLNHLVGRGAALAALSRGEEAEEAYRAAIRVNPEHVDAWYNLGNLRRRAGNGPGAREAYERVVAIGTDPTLSALAHENLEQLAR